MSNQRLYAGIAFLFGITVLVIGTTLFTGCTTQAPPPPPVVVAAPAPTPVPIPDPYAPLSSDVAAAIKHNQTPTLQHGITTVWPYSADRVYPLNCAALHVTQIRLRDDETTDKDNVKVGDKDRWGTIVGDHTVLIFPLGSVSSIAVPGAQITIPPDPHMQTNLAIHTTLHLPNGELVAGNDYMFDPVKEVKASKSFTEKVEFYYPDWVRQQDAARKQQEAQR